MDDSQSGWRENRLRKSASFEKTDSSFLVTESEEEIELSNGPRKHTAHLIESSSSEDEYFPDSRNSESLQEIGASKNHKLPQPSVDEIKQRVRAFTKHPNSDEGDEDVEESEDEDEDGDEEYHNHTENIQQIPGSETDDEEEVVINDSESDSDVVPAQKMKPRKNGLQSIGNDNQQPILNISDDSYNPGTSGNTSENLEDASGPSSEESSSHNVVESLVKAEIGVGNVDPFIAQKMAILTFNREQVQNRLDKSKLLLNSANIEMLPDKGEKLKHSIIMQEEELVKLSAEIDSLPLTWKIKKEENNLAASNNKTLPWKTLPTGTQAKVLGKKALETQQREQALTVERLEDLHNSLAACPTENQIAEDPRGLKVPLMPHQQHALAWLLWREKQKPPGGILADDMGLGKTLTMISLVMASNSMRDSDDSEDSDEEWQDRKKSRHSGGTLVVCPASLLSQWEGEVKRRCKRGVLSVEVYHGTNREVAPKRLAKNDIVITTYNLISREYKTNSTLYKINWKRIILDEAHVIRNYKSQASEAACGLHAKYRWALTGTPIHNKELDLYALLKFLKCSPFDDLRTWKRWVSNKSAAGQQRIATIMKTLMLRRTKQELQAKGALECMPDKNIEVIYVKLDSEEQLVYEKVLVYSRTLLGQFLAQRAEKQQMFELGAGKYDLPAYRNANKNTQFTKAQTQLLERHSGGNVKAHHILTLLLRLRQVCCHPALINAMLDREDMETVNGFEDDLLSKVDNMTLEDDEDKENEIGVDRRVIGNLLTSENPVFKPERQSSKMRAVLDTLKEILEKGDKAIVVSQWTSMLEVVRSHLGTIKGATYDVLSGNVAVKDRQKVMESFNAVDEDPQILLLSLTAGGVGLNLVGANHLLLLDIHWNPQLEAQAQDRIYRFGQKKSVFVYKFLCKDTIEERIRDLQTRKIELAEGVLTGAGIPTASKLSLDDLKSLFSLNEDKE